MDEIVEKIRSLSSGLAGDMGRLKTLSKNKSLKIEEEVIHTIMPGIVDLASALAELADEVAERVDGLEDQIGDGDLESRLLPDDAAMLREMVSSYGAIVEHSLSTAGNDAPKEGLVQELQNIRAVLARIDEIEVILEDDDGDDGDEEEDEGDESPAGAATQSRTGG